MSPSAPPQKRPAAASGRSPLVWHGLLGNLRRRPLFACAAGVISLGLIVSVGGLVVYPQCWGWYHWWQAQQATEAYDFPKARTHLEQCVRVWPHSGEAHFALARVARRGGDFTAARDELALARRFRWSEPAIELEQQLVQVQSGRVRPLDNYLQDAVAKGHEESLLILEALCFGYLENNFLPEASLTISIWLKLYPDTWQPHLLRGLLYEKGQRGRLAIEEYRRVLELKPDQPQARSQLATLLLAQLKQHEEALLLFEAHLRQYPDDVTALIGLARCQRASRHFAAAQAAVERVLRAEPEHAEGLYLRGVIAWEQDELPEALMWLDKAIKVAPHDLETNHALAGVLQEMGRGQEALPYQERRKALEADTLRLRRVLQELQELELADVKNKGTSLGQGLALRREVADLYARLGDKASATSWMLSVLERAPDDVDAHRQLAALDQKRTPPSMPPQSQPGRGIRQPPPAPRK